MALGCIIIAQNTGVALEVVSNQYTGYLLPDHCETWVNTLLSLEKVSGRQQPVHGMISMSQSTLEPAELSQNAKERVRNLYSIGVFKESIIQVVMPKN